MKWYEQRFLKVLSVQVLSEQLFSTVLWFSV